MIKKILTYPNETLNLVSKDVGAFDEEIYSLLDDMRDTLDNSSGLGLAAIQIGTPLNIIIIKYRDELIEAINPIITNATGVQHKTEGCLSIPKVSAIVERALDIHVDYMDRNGRACSIDASGLLAQIWQHETEHLKGGLYIDNLSKSKLKRLKATYKKSMRGIL